MVRIVFTGGSGKAGRHVIPYLVSQGHEILNLDLVDFPDPSLGVYTMKCNLVDSGQVFNALTSLFNMGEYAREDDWKERANGGYLGTPAMVIHFAAYARDMIVPDNLTFAANTQATYNVIEASCKLGVRKIIIASSETTYGVCFTQGEKGNEYRSFPLLEEYDIDPMDTYGLSKKIGEETARSFARRFAKAYPDGKGVDIYAFRIGNVVEPHEYARDFKQYLMEVDVRKRNAWSYIDARDLGKMCHLASQSSGLGFQVFNATNDTASSLLPTRTLLSLVAPNTPIIGHDLGEWEAPLSNRKMRKLLGFKDTPDWTWRAELESAGFDLGSMARELKENLAKQGRLQA
ncbi:MAG: hypothetical protein TREMPRED_005443 [Tremellales sp. Tagirdzhanova-0007]|nr:MAG: hypothetical protein TREMPRED_005443 [Tremellales sp. Tagirdzhanova-0007]